MKKETPRSFKRGAGLTDGLKTVGSVAGMPTTGREKRQSAVRKSKARLPGTLIRVSKAVLNHPGRDHATGWANSDGRLRPSRSLEAWGQPGHLAGAVILCLLLRAHQPSIIERTIL